MYYVVQKLIISSYLSINVVCLCNQNETKHFLYSLLHSRMDIDPDRALEALLNLLDRDSQGDNDHSSPDVSESDEDDDVPLVAAAIEHQIALNIQPTSPIRKRPRLGTNHCKYCEAVCSRETLEGHLNQSESCKSSYFEDLRVSNMDAVLSLLFKCIYCKEGPSKLSFHLNSSPRCLDLYCRRFGVESVR